MSQAPAASLHVGLLASKGNAQPSRGVAHPLIERLANTRSAPTLAAPMIVNAPQLPNAHAQGRISVRVDERQQLRLRLASAHLGKNRQMILVEALDHYLDKVMPAYLHERCPCIESGRGDGEGCHKGES